MKKETQVTIIAWLGALLMISIGVMASTWTEKIAMTIAAWLEFVIVFYVHQWLINHFFKKRKWLFYVSGLLALIAFLSPFKTFAERLFKESKGDVEYLQQALTTVLTIIFVTAVYYGYKGIMLQIQIERTKNQQAQAELKLLQSQVNPHFLFNTLNNIYAQSLVHPPKAGDMLVQLGDLMRYQIESAKKNEVSIKSEIDFIKNYLALERKRLIDTIKTDFTLEIAEDVDATVLKIPPMLFIPFIENAYKHGISADVDNFIFINLSVKNDSILFNIENKIPLKKRHVVSTNTGLENVKKRLNLLFNEKHTLNISIHNHIYHVQLEIKR
jgi:two-component system, LytTR family, sensor kinase